MTASLRFFLIVFTSIALFSCGKNNEKETNDSNEPKTTKEKKSNQNTSTENNQLQNTTSSVLRDDSAEATKESVLRKNKYKKKNLSTNNSNSDVKSSSSNNEMVSNSQPTNPQNLSFVYLKKILRECKIGVPMTQKELETNHDIPKEGIQLVKSITKISENELDVKWKSTWLIEKMSDAKFNDGRLKVRFDKNKMYTSGNAIAIKYEKKMYTDLILIGRSAYIPSVKGFYWQIGKD
jgi:hypothetical protein